MTNGNKENTNRWTFEQWKMWDHTCWTKKIRFNIKEINLTRSSTIQISAASGQPNPANFTLVLEDILQVVLTTSWKMKNCYTEDVFKTSSRHVLKTSWRHVLKMSWRHVLKTSLKTCLEDILKILWRQTKYLLGISVYLSGSNKSKCVSNKFVFHKSISDNSKANPKCIN